MQLAAFLRPYSFASLTYVNFAYISIYMTIILFPFLFVKHLRPFYTQNV